MVVIRLRRMGTKNRSYYRIIVADKRSPRDGRFIEQVGSYNPYKEKPEKVVIDGERVNYWLSKGAVPSDKVKSFLKELELIT